MNEPGTITFNETAVPEPGPGTVRIKVMSIGVCGSDIHVYKGEHPYVSYPLVQGHEVSGVVDKVGSGVTNVAEGDRITLEPQVSCGSCYPCTHGMPNICKNLKVLGFQTTGTASDYFVLPAEKIVPLPERISFDEGAMIEPTAVGVGAAKKIQHLDKQEALVFGAGPVGNLTAQVFRGLGVQKLMIADINEFRLQKAKECGIEGTVNTSAPNFREQISAFFGPEGPGLVIDCAGVNTTMDLGIELIRQGGSIAVIGVFPGKISMDINLTQEKELTIIGTARYVIEDFRTAIKLIEAGKINLQPLITHRFPFENYMRAYKQIEEMGDKTMKVIVQVNT